MIIRCFDTYTVKKSYQCSGETLGTVVKHSVHDSILAEQKKKKYNLLTQRQYQSLKIEARKSSTDG